MLNYPSTYYDRFDKTKGYKKLLFLSGNGLQAAELNEIQDVIEGELKRLGNYLVANGTITAGGSVTSIDLTNKVINLTVAQMYADGFSVDVPAASLTIQASGTEVVGVATDTTIVTQLDDTSITEPDQNSPNFGQTGALRLKMVGVWKLSTQVTTDETFFPVYTLNNGALVSSSTSTSTTGTQGLIASALAAYDYSVHGSYVIIGMGVSYNSTNGSGHILMNVAAGRCRVLGNENVFPLESTVTLDPMTDVGTVTGEPYVYSGAGTYTLRYSPIQSIQRVVGVKQVTQTVTRGGTAGGADLLANTPVLTIIAVNQGGTWNGSAFTSGTTYVKGTDYQQLGDQVDWSLAGAEPSPGSSYTAVYQYNAVFVPSFTTTGVTLDGSLVSGTQFTVDYSYYLSRKDLISVDQSGNFVVSKGVPALPQFVQTPQTPNGMLRIGVASLTYGQTPTIDSTRTQVVTYDQLATMQSQISDLQYNVAQLSLTSVAQANDPTTTKRGIIVDSLVNTNLEDAGFTQTAVVSNATLELPSNFTQFVNCIDTGITQPWNTAVVVQQQIRHTGSEKINPYAGATAISSAAITLAPASINCSSWWWWFHGSFLPENASTTAVLSGFNANETINVYYRGALVASGTADSTGKANIVVPIAAGVQIGSYLVNAVGVTSGVNATANLTIFNNDVYGVTYGWDYVGGAVPIGYDPVAQTFQLTQGTDINAVSIWLDELPVTQLQVKIVGTIAGIPNSSNLLGFGSLQPNQCVLGWNTVYLVYPIHLDGGVQGVSGSASGNWYAMIVTTSGYLGRVGTAVMGGYDTLSSTYVTSQPATGVFFQSANENTWSAVQNEDLMYKLWSPQYNTTPTTVSISNITVTNATDWNVSANMSVPAGCSVAMYLQDSLGNQYPMNINAPTYTTPLSGTLTLYATLKNAGATGNVSPKVYAGIGLYAGSCVSPGKYVQRQFSIPNGATTPATIKVFVDCYLPSGASLTVEYQTDNTNPGTWAGITLNSSTAIGNGWYTNQYLVSSVALNATRLRLTLATTNAQQRPLVQNIRTLLV